MRMTVATAVACLLGVGISTAHDAQAAIKQDTTIPAQGLGSALKQLAGERDIQLVYRSEVVGERQTSGAVGELTFDEALTNLLKGTGLTYQYLDDRAVTIVPVDSRSVMPAKAGVQTSSEPGVWERFRLAQAEQGSPRPSASSGDDSLRRSTLEEVIVTAQKREERLQDVPISITVLSGENLDKSSASGLTEILRRVPGVGVNENNINVGTQVSIRGVTASGLYNSGSSPVAYYLDEIPFGLIQHGFGPDLNPYDLDRVEVLRGPQGTLYGAGGENGVVRVLTHDTDLNRFDLKTRAGYSSTEDGGDGYRGDVAVNVPIIDGKFGARAVYGYQKLAGWIDRSNRDDINDGDRQNLRVKLNAQPTENLSLGGLAWVSRTDSNAAAIGTEDARRFSLYDEPNDTDFNAYVGTIGYDFGGVTLKSSTSYLDYESVQRGDLSVLLPALFGSDGVNADIFAQELYLSSDAEGPLSWTVGGQYRNAKENTFAAGCIGCAMEELPDSPAELLDQYPGSTTNVSALLNEYRSESSAVFGELTYAFFDGRFELTGGLRYFEDRVNFHAIISSSPINPALERQSKKFDALSPRVVARWKPSEDVSVYASYAEGFRSGFLQANTRLPLPSADPDTLHNYELGTKGELAGGRLGYEAAVYYIKWDDVQQRLNMFVPGVINPITGLPMTAAAIVNAPSASGAGVDLALTARPMDAFSFGVSTGWNDLTVDSDVLSGGIVLYNEGERLNTSPEWTLGANADYEFALTANYKATISASTNYTSKIDSRLLTGNTIKTSYSDPLWMSHLSFAISSQNWKATLFGENITNEQGLANRFPLANILPDANTLIRPRTIGVQLEYQFR